MSEITIRITDQADTKVVTAKVPSNVPMNRLLPALVKKIGLPDGKYKLVHKETGKELDNYETLETISAQSDDYFRIIALGESKIHLQESCSFCQAQITVGEQIIRCPKCSVAIHYSCAQYNNFECPSRLCKADLQKIRPNTVEIVVSGTNAEEVESVARALLKQTQIERSDVSTASININGNVSGSTIIIGNENETQNSSEKEE